MFIVDMEDAKIMFGLLNFIFSAILWLGSGNISDILRLPVDLSKT